MSAMLATPDDFDLETTADVPGARRALRESRSAARHTDRVVDDAKRVTEAIRATRESDPFTERFRAILRGVA